MSADASSTDSPTGAQVWRDAWGIPHIRAANPDQAFSALGFVHAQDRLFQMESLLRRGTGRHAEWVGKTAIKADTLARQLDTLGASQRDFAALGAPAQAMLTAYARGVNDFIATGARPVEYGLLKTEPGAWEPWHSIAVMRQIGFLMGSVWWKLWRAAAPPIVGAAALTRLRFEDGGDELMCLPPGLSTGPYQALMADLQPGVAALLETAAPDVSGGGSNNWALAPGHTETGRPLVAGDPHRVLEMPNMYAQVHLACDRFDVIGMTVPGLPYKLSIWVISAVICGIAGALYVPQVGIINPSEMSPANSIEIAIWAAVGGRASLIGPIAGAFMVNGAKSWLTVVAPEYWLYVLGALFIAVTLYMPQGVLGLLVSLKQRLHSRKGESS